MSKRKNEVCESVDVSKEAIDEACVTEGSKKDNTQEKTKEKKKKTGIASISFFVALLDWFGDIIYNALIHGFFGRIFASYSVSQNHFQTGMCGGLLNGKKHSIFRRARRFLASNIESGFFINKARRLMKYFTSLPLNSYGNFFLFFGIYTVVVYFIKMLIPNSGTANSDYLLVGIITSVAAIPMMFSRVALSTCVKKSVIGKMIFQGAFGFSDEAFSVKNTKGRGKGTIMLFLGLVIGLMTFFIHPLSIILSVLAIVLVCIIAAAPEIGVLLTILFVPLLSFVKYPTVSLCVLILVTAFFYFLKLIRGKRVFKLEVVDAFVVLFGLVILISDVFSAGGQAGTNSVLVTVTLLLGYFLLVNLMRTEKWIKRCVFALVGSAALVAAIGIIEFAFGLKGGTNAWLDLSLFSNIRLRVVSLFENPNVLSAFLVMIFPFAVTLRVLSTKKNEKTLSFVVCLMIVLCTIFTWSRGAWLGLLAAAFVFLIFYSKRAIRFFTSILILIPVLPLVIPDSVINRFLSITNLSDSSIAYRLYTWKGTFNVIGNYFLGGIGFGNEAFQNVYPYYAYSGMEAAQHSHSLFLQILVGMGIVGLAVFGIVLFLNFQKCLEYIKTPENRNSRIFVSAAVSAIVAALVMGVFDYIWYNYRVFYIFWIIIAIGCAFVRVGNSEAARKQSVIDAQFEELSKERK